MAKDHSIYSTDGFDTTPSTRTSNHDLPRSPTHDAAGASPQTTRISDGSRLEERIEELALWIFETREETRIGLSGAEKRIVAKIKSQRRRLEEAMDKRQEECKRVESMKVDYMGLCVLARMAMLFCYFFYMTLWVFMIKR